jgi:phosphodiesterase/alkaline phosphatase D-like protein
MHRVLLRDLEPDTEYAYRVSADHGFEPGFGRWWQARTAPASRDAEFRAAFLCDVGLDDRFDGTATAATAVLAQLVDDAPLFVLGGGDYAYGNRDERFRDPADAIDRWFEQMEPLFASAPFMAQFGNHDVALVERFADWAPRFSHPAGAENGRSYSFDVGSAHFVGLFAPGRAPSEAHLRWLKDDLSSERARRAAWRIVFQHAPVVATVVPTLHARKLQHWLRSTSGSVSIST